MAEVLYYVDDYTDEVLPCAPTLQGWATWLANPNDDGIDPATPGDEFAVSTIVVLGDIQVDYVDGAWVEATPVPEGTTGFYLRHNEGGAGWDVDHSGDTVENALDCMEADESPAFLACVKDGDSLPYRFDVGADGPTLVPLGGVTWKP